MSRKHQDEYTDDETEKRAAEIIRRSFELSHTPRKAVAPKTVKGRAQRRRRAKVDSKAR